MSGPPTCVCSLCNQIVLKAQTRHIGEGKRACKSHDGVQDQARAAQAQDEAKRRADEASRRRHAHEFRYGLSEAAKERDRLVFSPDDIRHPDYVENTRHFMQNCCWTCGREGVSIREYYLRMLLWGERTAPDSNTDLAKAPAISMTDWFFAGLTGKAFSREEVWKALGLPKDHVILNRVPLPTDPKVRGYILDCCSRRKALDQVLEMLGFVQVCNECVPRLGIDPNVWHPTRPATEITADSLSEMAAVYETVVRPVLQAMISESDTKN